MGQAVLFPFQPSSNDPLTILVDNCLWASIGAYLNDNRVVQTRLPYRDLQR